MDAEKPIGVFDSGVGGLTVLREIARTLPGERLIYLGDSARVPYGTKSPETVLRYTREAAAHLLGHDIKMLVVACNTASAAAVPALRRELDIPIVSVIEPGARAAVMRGGNRIGVIATEGTVRSRAYRDAILALTPQVEVFEAACPLFVPLAEEGWGNTRVCQEIAEIYLEPLIDSSIDTLVLGCTHYPILRHTLKKVVGDRVTIVDSAETTAEQVSSELRRLRLLNVGPRKQPQFIVTDDASRFRRIAGEFLDHAVSSLELVSLDPLPSEVMAS